MHLLNPKLIEEREALTQQFKSAEPFRHIFIDDFFKTEFCQALVNQFPAFDDKKALNENKEVGKKAVNERITEQSIAYKQLDKLVKSDEFLDWVSQLTGINKLQYDPYYFGGGTHENLQGQGLDPHVDFTHHPMTSQYRRLNLIVYLNNEWLSEWGGNIELHKNPRLKLEEDHVISIKPLFNRVVIFETHHISWHGFPVIQLPNDKKHISRKSFALYYYSKEKPKNFKQPHSTIYVDRPISAHIKAGHRLTEDDHQEIQRLLNSRDQHVHRLYNTITEQMDKLAKLKIALGVFWVISWPYRKLKNLFRRNK